MMNSESRQ